MKNESDKAYMKRFRKEADKRIGTIEQIKDEEGNVQKAKSWERYEMGVRLPDEEAATPAEFAEMVLKNIKLVPQLAHGGLARILEV